MTSKITNKDFILGCFVIGVSVLLLRYTYKQEETAFFISEDISPFLIPSYYLYISIICGGLLCLNGLRTPCTNREELKHIHTFAILCTSLLTVYVMGYFGYLLIMPISVFICGLLIGYKKKLTLMVSSIVTSVVIWFCLENIGNMPLPSINIG